MTAKRIDLYYKAYEGFTRVVPYIPKLSWLLEQYTDTDAEIKISVQRFIIPHTTYVSLPVTAFTDTKLAFLVNPDDLTIDGSSTVTAKVNSSAAADLLPVAPRQVFSQDITSLYARNSSLTVDAELLLVKISVSGDYIYVEDDSTLWG